ncbi:hypothetical protein BX600DRAFT_464121 [Xylariales sp. PMI_506]|nr:hypothetical protein BX600DRAFT_464121 [Xylariales sp. PMI_506]
MAFLEDPRLRQRWNQISHTTEAVTENAAAGIWSFGHTYVTPCLDSIAAAFDSCTAPCLGDREDRARRRRERELSRAGVEYSFDFYDDWDDELGGEEENGILGGWRSEHWDRLLAGSGKGKRGEAGEVREQPRTRKRGMSYGTRGARRKSSEVEDPTIIPSTQPIGFLGKLPFKIGGTLRYKPSAANLQEHPGGRHPEAGEREPLLRADDDDDIHDLDDEDSSGDEERHYFKEPHIYGRQRSGTTGSGDTSDSYRSRGDLFPSDGEGDEDAVPLDDEFAVTLGRMDDRSSSKTKSSKGKRTARYSIPRSGSRTTIDSTMSRPTSLLANHSPIFDAADHDALPSALSIEDLQQEEEQVQRDEDEAISRKREAAAQLALERGLHRQNLEIDSVPEVKAEMVQVSLEDRPAPEQAEILRTSADAAAEPGPNESPTGQRETSATGVPESDGPGSAFVPARLPYFG